MRLHGTKKLSRYGFVCVVLVYSLFGCTPVKRPFLFVQMCVRDEHDLSDVKELLRSIAVSDGMKFSDYSKRTTGNSGDRRNTTPTTLTENLDMGAFDRDGVGFGVADTKIFANQISIAFSEGSNPTKAHRIAEEVIYKLKAIRRAQLVSSDGRVLPNLHCKANL
jgi:hypothetical protein